MKKPSRKDIEGYAAVVSAKDPSRMIERALSQPAQKSQLSQKSRQLNPGQIETLTFILRDAWNASAYKYLTADLVRITKYLAETTGEKRIQDLLLEFRSDLL